MNQAAFDWPITRLGEIISHRKEFIEIDDTEKYKRCRVQLHAKGIVLRDEVEGITIKTKKQQVCRAGELLVAEIDAKVGGFGIVPTELDGAIVSSHYFLYSLNPVKVDSAFINYFVKTPFFRDQVKAQGSTNYAAIRPNQVLDYEIPLPSLSEQSRIVAKIDRLAAKVEEASGLKAASAFGLMSLTSSIYGRAFQERKGWEIKAVSDFCEKPQYGYTASASQEKIGPHLLRITDIQDGKVNWPSVPFCVCAEPGPYLLKENDILFARTGATTGKSFLIKDCPETVFASYLIRLRIKDSVLPEYLYAFFQTPNYWKQITDEMKGTGQPNCNGKKLANVKVPIPSKTKQREIVEYLDDLQTKVDNLKAIQSKTAVELDAMLPSILDKAFKGEL